jgi:ectoine hydroxylase-related dioxygenase (phytanoyl-CoA dioxygenase family)
MDMAPNHGAVQLLARSAPIRRVAEEALGPNCFAVRGILFDKTPNTNWKVTWHQDLTIAVRERRDSAGFASWTEKDGVAHVQPPHTVLERMVAVRIHLDPCGLDNGPVRVLSGSHRHGRLTGKEIDTWKARVPATDCLVERGGILAFFPLLLHASSPSQSPTHRRVVHLEFAAGELKELPGGLAWHQIV